MWININENTPLEVNAQIGNATSIHYISFLSGKEYDVNEYFYNCHVNNNNTMTEN